MGIAEHFHISPFFRTQCKRLILLFTLALTLLQGQNTPYFDGSRAMELLEAQCAFGPRYPGSAAHDSTAQYFEKFLKPLADELKIYPTTVINPQTNQPVRLVNLLARFTPEAPDHIMFLAHWDTREIAEKDPDPIRQKQPILGANDGASGVAILLALAEILKAYPPNMGVDLLLVDGEDMGLHTQMETWGLGTKAVAHQLPRPYPRYAICLDMVGDAELDLPMEPYSVRQAPELVAWVWSIGEQLGYTQFRRELGPAVYDDHRVLYLNTGIPAIDIIDFHYPNAETNYWHTQADTPDKCSAESLEAVGTVVTTLIYLESEQYNK